MNNRNLLLDLTSTPDSLRQLSKSPPRKSEESKLYNLTRGELALFDETHLSKMQKQLREKKFDDIKTTISEAKLSNNFAGTFYSVFFKVNRPIVLKSLGFWGPFNKESASYDVQIIMSKIGPHIPTLFDSSKHATILDKLASVATGKKKEIFDVPIPQKLELLENTWYRIQFQLNGPDTGICAAIKSSYKCKESGIDFEFVDSSHQLPRITFSLPEKS